MNQHTINGFKGEMGKISQFLPRTKPTPVSQGEDFRRAISGEKPRSSPTPKQRNPIEKWYNGPTPASSPTPHPYDKTLAAREAYKRLGKRMGNPKMRGEIGRLTAPGNEKELNSTWNQQSSTVLNRLQKFKAPKSPNITTQFSKIPANAAKAALAVKGVTSPKAKGAK